MAYHSDFWVAITPVAAGVALGIVVLINRYRVAFAFKAWSSTQRQLLQAPTEAANLADEGNSADPVTTANLEARRDRLRRVATAGVTLQIVSWAGFTVATLIVLEALLSLAWTKDRAVPPAWTVLALVVSGATLPVQTLLEKRLLQIAKAAGLKRKDL